MQRRSVTAVVMILLGSVALGISLGSIVRAVLRESEGPRVHLESPAESPLIAEDKSSVVVASYRLVNNGDRNLVLGQTTTTCGCTIASIDPTVVPPRGSATVKVHGEPSEAGERDVHITVETNDKRSPILNLELVMVGATPMPFIGHTSGPIQFGTIERNDAAADFYFDTHERQESSPWLLDVRSPLPGFSIVAGTVQIVKKTGDAIIRRHHYHATFHPDQPSSGLLGHVALIDPSAPARAIHQIQVLGIVHSPVYAIPQAIYGSFDGSNFPLPIRVSVHGSPDFPLRVTPENNPDFSCQLVERTSSRLDYMITFKPERLASTLTTKATFLTNHPKSPRFEVPVVVQRVGK